MKQLHHATLAVLLLTTLASSCSDEAGVVRKSTRGGADAVDACETPAAPLFLADPVSYDVEIKKFVDTNCVSCHNGNVPPLLNSYETVKAAAVKSAAEMQAGSMPPGKTVGAPDQTAFAAWIAGNFLKTVVPPATPPPATTPPATTPPAAVKKVAYQGAVQALIKDNCLSCHGANATAPDLSTFALVKAGAVDSAAEISGDTMPPGKPLSQANKDLFASWVKDGLLETLPAAPPATAKPAVDGAKKPVLPAAETQDTAGVAGDPSIILPKSSDAAACLPAASGSEPDPSKTPVENPAPEPAAIGSGDAKPEAALVSYNAAIKGFFAAKCVSCHAAGATAPDLTSFALAKAKGAASGKRIAANTMPPGGGLTPAEQAAYKAWIDGGYKE